jgi:hypothetical protein
MALLRAKSEVNPTDLRCLVVQVIEARNLVTLSKTGDDHLHLRLYLAGLGAKEIKSESFSARPLTNTVAPKWQETFTFGSSHHTFLGFDSPFLNFLPINCYSREELQFGYKQSPPHSACRGLA